MALKRTADSLALVPELKRTRQEVSAYTNKDKALLEVVHITSFRNYDPLIMSSLFQGVTRTSNLFAPIMHLEGHQGEVFTCEFHPDGDLLVSTGFDRQICINFWIIH